MDIKHKEIKISFEDNYSVNPDGELENEPVIDMVIRPIYELKFINMKITVLPTGAIFK